MKRWNGWGDENVVYPLSAMAMRYLEGALGVGQPADDALISEVISKVPPSRLPQHPLILPESEVRLRHACGHSLPDWIALRSGHVRVFPDGVAFPSSGEAVRALLDLAIQHGFNVIPYGGGTSVVGHINPIHGDRPTLMLDLSRLDRLVDLRPENRLATFEAGVVGPNLEEQLRKRGYTLGHFPQSFEYSTLGGWIATRSSGQQSYYYGRIEEVFAGGRLETPVGSIDFPPFPASAAGPDLRQIVLGSEGRLGVLTQATVRIHSIPEVERFYGIFFRDWESGIEAVRELVQENAPLSMIRLSDAQETETTLMLSGNETLIAWGDWVLGILNYKEHRCLLLFGVTGNQKVAKRARTQAYSIARAHGGFPLGRIIGETWRKSRFFTPYLRNTLWEHGYAVDTLETAFLWSEMKKASEAIKESIRMAIGASGELCLVFTHLSHIYPTGASIYVTYLFRRSPDPDETFQLWKKAKNAASQVIVAHGGTISHHHGVGIDHVPYLASEKGTLGVSAIQDLCKRFDPYGLMNPGKLVE